MKEFEDKLMAVRNRLKKRYPKKAVTVEFVTWDYSSGNLTNFYNIWVETVINNTRFYPFEELEAYIDSFPVRNPILYRNFGYKGG